MLDAEGVEAVFLGMADRRYWDARRQALDPLADAYDRYRPKHPEALYPDLVRLARLPADGRILEIGCGTGQATTLLARLGRPLVGIEPGATLAARTRQNCAGFANVRIEESRFETWVHPPHDFDLVFAAQSFHFLDPADRLGRVARQLKPAGALAVVWSYRCPGESAAHRAVQAAYARHAPSATLYQLVNDAPFEAELSASARFANWARCEYRWHQVYDIDGFIGLLTSHGRYRIDREINFSGLRDAVRSGLAETGGTIELEYLTRLYVARDWQSEQE
jgi:SAM-dependent methyltransferase